MGFERAKEASRGGCDFIDCGDERAFVGLRRFVEAAYFSHELKRSGANLFVGDRRIEIVKNFDVPAHCRDLEILRTPEAAQKILVAFHTVEKSRLSFIQIGKDQTKQAIADEGDRCKMLL
jgi:hypothetical protein